MSPQPIALGTGAARPRCLSMMRIVPITAALLLAAALPAAAQVATGGARSNATSSSSAGATGSAGVNPGVNTGPSSTGGAAASTRAGGGRTGPGSVWLLCLPAGVEAQPFLTGTDISCAP